MRDIKSIAIFQSKICHVSVCDCVCVCGWVQLGVCECVHARGPYRQPFTAHNNMYFVGHVRMMRQPNSIRCANVGWRLNLGQTARAPTSTTARTHHSRPYERAGARKNRELVDTEHASLMWRQRGIAERALAPNCNNEIMQGVRFFWRRLAPYFVFKLAAIPRMSAAG